MLAFVLVLTFSVLSIVEKALMEDLVNKLGFVGKFYESLVRIIINNILDELFDQSKVTTDDLIFDQGTRFLTVLKSFETINEVSGKCH